MLFIENFVEKYNFSLIDFENSIEEWINNNFVCYFVKELAYEICSRVYSELNYEPIEYCILYKLSNINNRYIHNIIFQYEDIYFHFSIIWYENSLKITEWEIIDKTEFENINGYEDIENVLED